MATASDRFEAAVDRVLESGTVAGKRPICDDVSARAAAIRAVIEENPTLHQEMLAEVRAQAQGRRFQTKR